MIYSSIIRALVTSPVKYTLGVYSNSAGELFFLVIVSYIYKTMQLFGLSPLRNSQPKETHISITACFCWRKKLQKKNMTDFTLLSPPQGRSIADDFAEHINQWVEKKMQKSVTEIELKRQRSVGKMSKEQKDLLKDMAKIKNVKGAAKRDQRKPAQTTVSSPSFLAKEKARLQALRENAKADEYRSDGNSSDDGSSVYSLEDEEEEIASPPSKDSLTILKPNTRKLSAKKSSCEERLRDTRIANLQRRYSAQVRTEPIVNVNRRLKYDKK